MTENCGNTIDIMNCVSDLIVNADDFGIAPDVNRAIIDAFEQGLVSSTTMLTTTGAFEDALQLAHDHRIQNKIGAHLCLTEGVPLSEESHHFPFLFNGNMNFRERIFRLYYPTRELRRIIYQEFNQQIIKLIEKQIPISHIDTHHQLHDIHGIQMIIMDLMKRHRIPKIRILNNMERAGWSLKTAYRQQSNKKFFRKNIHFSDYMGSQKDFLIAMKSRKKLFSGKTIEIMVHPVYNNKGFLVDKIGPEEYSLNTIMIMNKM